MKSVRRIVTGNDEAGVSRVISVGELASSHMTELWRTDAQSRLGSEPSGNFVLEPPPGGSCWRIVEVPPDIISREYFQQGVPGHDDEGFHCTNTVDYVFVLEGEITLELDEGQVDLRTGDCVVQRGTNHVWRNRGETPVRLLCVMVSAARD